jgi:hypothetical protein
MILALILSLSAAAQTETLIDRCVAGIIDSEFTLDARSLDDKLLGVKPEGIRHNDLGQLVITYQYENGCAFTKTYAYRQYGNRCDVQNVGPNSLSCE